MFCVPKHCLWLEVIQSLFFSSLVFVLFGAKLFCAMASILSSWTCGHECSVRKSILKYGSSCSWGRCCRNTKGGSCVSSVQTKSSVVFCLLVLHLAVLQSSFISFKLNLCKPLTQQNTNPLYKWGYSISREASKTLFQKCYLLFVGLDSYPLHLFLPLPSYVFSMARIFHFQALLGKRAQSMMCHGMESQEFLMRGSGEAFWLNGGKKALAWKWVTCCSCVLVSRGVFMHLPSSSLLFLLPPIWTEDFFCGVCMCRSRGHCCKYCGE